MYGNRIKRKVTAARLSLYLFFICMRICFYFIIYLNNKYILSFSTFGFCYIRSQIVSTFIFLFIVDGFFICNYSTVLIIIF